MFIPLFDSRIKNASKPVMNWILILVCIVVYLYQAYLSRQYNGQELMFYFNYEYAVIPSFITTQFHLGTLISYIFIHGGAEHLLFNMLYLFIFGDNLEAVLGKLLYTIFFLVGGIVAAICHVLVFSGSTTPLIGASGAVSAVMGAYLVLFPKSKITTIVLFFPFRVLSIILILVWFGSQLFYFYKDHVNMENQNTAWLAHIGGFLFGILVGIILRIMKKPVELVED